MFTVAPLSIAALRTNLPIRPKPLIPILPTILLRGSWESEMTTDIAKNKDNLWLTFQISSRILDVMDKMWWGQDVYWQQKVIYSANIRNCVETVLVYMECVCVSYQNTDLRAGICFGWESIVRGTHFELFWKLCSNRLTNRLTYRQTDIPIPRCFVAEA